MRRAVMDVPVRPSMLAFQCFAALRISGSFPNWEELEAAQIP